MDDIGLDLPARITIKPFNNMGMRFLDVILLLEEFVAKHLVPLHRFAIFLSSCVMLKTLVRTVLKTLDFTQS